MLRVFPIREWRIFILLRCVCKWAALKHGLVILSSWIKTLRQEYTLGYWSIIVRAPSNTRILISVTIILSIKSWFPIRRHVCWSPQKFALRCWSWILCSTDWNGSRNRMTVRTARNWLRNLINILRLLSFINMLRRWSFILQRGELLWLLLLVWIWPVVVLITWNLILLSQLLLCWFT